MSASDFLSRHVAALTSGDLDAIVALYADDATLLSFEWVADGRDAIRDRFRAFLDFHGEISSVELRYQQSTDDAAFAMYALTGERGTFRLVNAFVLDGDVCTRHFSNEVSAELNRDEVQPDRE